MKKTYLPYYGGKAAMLREILPIVTSVPGVQCFCEPYTGGGAIMHNAQPYPVMIINDTFDDLVNLYQVLQDNPAELLAMVKRTPHSRSCYRDALEAKRSPLPIRKAWGTFCLLGFAMDYSGGFRTARRSGDRRWNHARKWAATKERLIRLSSIMDRYTIEALDALECIHKYDAPETLFYIDPPYPGADQGHYEGFTDEHFQELLEVLRGVRGKWVLSCYRRNLPELLPEMFRGYKVKEGPINAGGPRGARKQEFIGWNFDQEPSLFDGKE